MARLYETVEEQKARELRDYYAGRTPEPATMPPHTIGRRGYPRYQTTAQQARKAADAFKKSYRYFVRATGRLS